MRLHSSSANAEGCGGVVLTRWRCGHSCSLLGSGAVPEPQPPPPSQTNTVEPVLPGTALGRWLVVVVLLAGLAFRVGAVFENRSTYVPKTDAQAFDDVATSIAHGHGYGYSEVPPFTLQQKQPSAFRAPLYPLVLAPVYVVFGGHSWTAGRLENAVLGTALVAMFGVFVALLWNRRMAFIAMAMAALYPTLVLTGSSLQLEPLLGLLSLASLSAALQYRREPHRMRWAAASGITLGLAILTREIGFALVLPVAWLLWAARDRRPRFRWATLKAPVAFVALAVLVVIPWTIRNAVTFHTFVPVSTSAGVGLAGTFNETTVANRVNQAEWIAPWFDPQMAKIIVGMAGTNEAEISNRLVRASIDVEKRHPAYILRVGYWNTERLFDLDRGHYTFSTVQYIPYSLKLAKLSVYSSYLVYLLALIGLFYKKVREVPLAVWAVPVLIYLGLVFFLPAQIRYRSSLEPFLLLLASLPVATVAEALLARFGPKGAGQPEIAAPASV